MVGGAKLNEIEGIYTGKYHFNLTNYGKTQTFWSKQPFHNFFQFEMNSRECN